mgnify:CR=1 FL=1
MPNQNLKKWSLLIVLSLIWGSSFILIKKGLVGLSPLQLGGFRIVISALFIFIPGYNSLKNITHNWYCKFDEGVTPGTRDHRGYFEIVSVR